MLPCQMTLIPSLQLWIDKFKLLYGTCTYFIDFLNYRDSSSIVFRNNFTLTGFNFIVTVCCPFLVASHGLSHGQAGLSHSRCRQHGSTAALSFPFGKAKVSQPQPRQVKPWQHYCCAIGALIYLANLCYICNLWPNWEMHLCLFNMRHIIYVLDRFFNVNSMVASVLWPD